MKKPTLEEIKLFCAKVGLSESDAEWAYWKWDGNGWTNGGKPIKRWTSTIMSWKAAGYMPSQRYGRPNINQPTSVANSRNQGVAAAGPDFGSLAARKLLLQNEARQRELQAKLDQQKIKPGPSPS